MNAFNVEVVTRPIENGDWGALRAVTDHLPGTILLEDPDEPMLVIPVDASTLRSAVLLVQGAMSVLGHEIVWGRAYQTGVHTVRREVRRTSGDTDLTPAWLEDEAVTLDARKAVPA